MKIKKGDQIILISGKYKGKKGKVLASYPGEGRILVDGINIRKRHQRPRKEGERGQIVEKPGPIYVSSVMLVCPKCGTPTRVGSKMVDKKKYRVCKKCNQEV